MCHATRSVLCCILTCDLLCGMSVSATWLLAEFRKQLRGTCIFAQVESTTNIPKPKCISNQIDTGIQLCHDMPCVDSFSKQPPSNKITNQCVESNHICYKFKQHVDDHQYAEKQTSRTLDTHVSYSMVSLNPQPLQPNIFAQYGWRFGKSLLGILPI